jgi:hypothetical protein
MKNILLSLLIGFFFLHSLSGQDLISVVGKSPYPQNVKVYFTGFNGFEKLDLGSIRTMPGGEIDFFTDYHGFCTIKADGYKSYPLILQHDPVCIEWGDIPKFTCESENEAFYKYLSGFSYTDSLLRVFLSTNDSLNKIKSREELSSLLESQINQVSGGDAPYAEVFMQAEIRIRRAKILEDKDQMDIWKEDILAFIDAHYDALYNSHYMAKLAGAYLEMNRIVFDADVGLQQAMEYDIDLWMTSLGPSIGEREVANFFLAYCMKTDELELASTLVAKYIDYVKCDQYVSSKLRPLSMPYTFNVFFGPQFSNVRSLDQFQGMRKVLALFSTECPASVAAVTGLFAFVTENQIRLPVILVPDYELEGEMGVLIEEKAPFGLQAGFKTGSSLMTGAGIKQLPAFMVLDRNNLLEEVFYDLEVLKTMLKGDE